MRIGDFTVFLISMKFFFSFQLAVYRLMKNQISEMSLENLF